jgi:8-oxo-dGTP pyrophosphatase MutT (NUDIX family)
VNPEHVRQTLRSYLERFPADKERMTPIEAALAREGEALSSRCSPGHLTAGAIVIDSDSRTVLQIHHVKLDRWLLPGGHVEPCDASLTDAARRELVEEAGAIGRAASLIVDYPLDIDVHAIPPRPDRSESEHLHFDFRFGFVSSIDEVELDKDEVADFRWTGFDELGRLGERVESLLVVHR